jgi:hypothetical protein
MAMEENENPYHYTGLHAFGFLAPTDVPPDEIVRTVRELGEPPEGPVIFAGAFVGDYAGLVHLRAENLGELQATI